mmetsp:Transcript_5189/g.16690  ORF Transcript_5189/g.16690 Transcript_5189/m.16690 type:complete len:315 (-) Transcript_5189:116-1060(-)
MWRLAGADGGCAMTRAAKATVAQDDGIAAVRYSRSTFHGRANCTRTTCKWRVLRYHKTGEVQKQTLLVCVPLLVGFAEDTRQPVTKFVYIAQSCSSGASMLQRFAHQFTLALYRLELANRKLIVCDHLRRQGAGQVHGGAKGHASRQQGAYKWITAALLCTQRHGTQHAHQPNSFEILCSMALELLLPTCPFRPTHIACIGNDSLKQVLLNLGDGDVPHLLLHLELCPTHKLRLLRVLFSQCIFNLLHKRASHLVRKQAKFFVCLCNAHSGFNLMQKVLPCITGKVAFTFVRRDETTASKSGKGNIGKARKALV